MHLNCVVILQPTSRARCLVKVKLVPLVVALVEGFPWVEAEPSFLDHLVREGTVSLVLLGLEVHHHTSQVSVLLVY